VKRQTNPDLTSRNYTYGCVPSRVAVVRNEELAHTQLQLANRLWNVLVTIERYRVERYRRIMHNENQEHLKTTAKKIGEIRTAIKAARQKTRNRKNAKIVTDPLQEQVKQLSAERKEIIERLTSTKEQRHKEKGAELEQEQQMLYKHIRWARQAAGDKGMGFYWATANNMIQRLDAARKLGEPHYR
jgi:hypothetical protein